MEYESTFAHEEIEESTNEANVGVPNDQDHANNDIQDSDTDCTIFVPQVSQKSKPHNGQSFLSLEEAYQFYNSYGKEGGFGVRKSSTRLNRSGERLSQKFVCNRQGESKEKIEECSRRHGRKRDCCEAKIHVYKKPDGWVFDNFIESHNHSLATPRRRMFFRSHRKVPPHQRVFVDQLSQSNVPTCQRMSILAVQAGGIGNVGCLQKDLYNYDTEKCKAWRGHDANILLEHCEREKNKNVAFTYIFDTDDEMCVTRCFWADAICRANYNQFGDVVVFDSTYNTNKYSLVFTPFCGVNNHGQTMLFAESFIWLYEEFKKAMSGKIPKMIITDQDLGMAKAILQCFPQTFHRYCIWHITNKFPEKLATSVDAKTKPAFEDCIWNSHYTWEFEENWSRIIEHNGLSDHDWLQTLYEMRSRWVPVNDSCI